MDPNDVLYADRIIIDAYNPLWPEKAALEIASLKLAISYPWVMDFQHVGSTAVPGLAAKPIIDIYVGVTSIKEAQAAIQPIQDLGYQYWDENPNKEKMFFVKGMPPRGEGRTHHIHIVAHNSRYWRAVTLFRDYLCAHPDEAARYAALKYELMQRYPLDREAYTDAKTAFVADILRQAGFKELVQR